MPRDYFSQTTGASVSGTVITDIQSSLNAVTAFAIGVDGIFGRQTRQALSGFQTDRGLPVTGTVSDTTWPALMHSAEPPIFERCLQVVASFEGTGFSMIEGNFDGAGLTWGIIGFTLSNGELSSLLGEISDRSPDLLTQAFGHDATALLGSIGPASTAAQRMAFANSVSGPAPQFRVAEPWRSGFARLGALREVQRLQVDRARAKYWTAIALRDAQDLGVVEELDLLLLFDVAVQNGGMRSKGRLEAAQAQITDGMAAREKRRVIAQVVADSITGPFKGDVLARKTSIANGGGTVHGASYDLGGWGLMDGFAPASV
jgi:hypothetical protein